jgi:hypothetical protein
MIYYNKGLSYFFTTPDSSNGLFCKDFIGAMTSATPEGINPSDKSCRAGPSDKSCRAGPSDKSCRAGLLCLTSNFKTTSNPLCRPPHRPYAGISPPPWSGHPQAIHDHSPKWGKEAECFIYGGKEAEFLVLTPFGNTSPQSLPFCRIPPKWGKI